MATVADAVPIQPPWGGSKSLDPNPNHHLQRSVDLQKEDKKPNEKRSSQTDLAEITCARESNQSLAKSENPEELLTLSENDKPGGTERYMKNHPAEQTLLRMDKSAELISKAFDIANDKRQPTSLEVLLPIIQQLEKEKYQESLHCYSRQPSRKEQRQHRSLEITPKCKNVPTNPANQGILLELKREVKQASKERNEVKKLVTCVFCQSNSVDTLFLTCRHYVACKSCTDMLRDCPVCESEIVGTVEVFLA